MMLSTTHYLVETHTEHQQVDTQPLLLLTLLPPIKNVHQALFQATKESVHIHLAVIILPKSRRHFLFLKNPKVGEGILQNQKPPYLDHQNDHGKIILA